MGEWCFRVFIFRRFGVGELGVGSDVVFFGLGFGVCRC